MEPTPARLRSRAILSSTVRPAGTTSVLPGIVTASARREHPLSICEFIKRQ